MSVATAAAASAGPTRASSVPFAEFFYALRRNGFAVGLGHYARMLTVLDQVGPRCTPRQLRTVLCPLFATSAEQQERFYRLFDQWFPIFVLPPDHEATAQERSEVPVPPVRRGPAPRRRNLLLPVAALSFVTVVALSWWLLGRPEAPVTSVTPAPSGPTVVAPTPSGAVSVVSPPAPVAPPAPQPAAKPRPVLTRPFVRNTLVLTILAGLIAIEVLLYRRRRLVLERQRRERPPLVWPIRVESAAVPLVESAEFYIAARRLRERQTGERAHLDVGQTIAATIQALGFPVLRYVLETRPPDYLVLIERVAQRDHQSSLYRDLVDSLAAEGVHTTVYYYDDDPRVCEPASGGAATLLSELRRRFPTHRLFIFGSGDALIDPITGRRKAWVGDAFSWPDRAVLTPEPSDHWGAREIALASSFVVLPATIAGLQAAIDHFQLPSRQAVSAAAGRRLTFGPRVPELTGSDAVRVLRHQLGERGLQWVCACAVYPELQWRLTLHLGMLPEVSGGRLDDELLLTLVRLPWFRTGSIPDEARSILLRVIRPDVDRAARSAVLTLLERNPAPAETIAASRYDLDLVVQKLALHGRDRARRRELMRVAQRMPRDKVVRELAVLRLVEQDPGTRLAMQLPSRLRDVFFQNGLPVLGLTTGARSLVAVALMAGVLVASREPRPRSEATLAAGGARDSAAGSGTQGTATAAARRDSGGTATPQAAGTPAPITAVASGAARTAPAQAGAGADSVASRSLDDRRAGFRQIVQNAIRLYESFQVEAARALLAPVARDIDILPGAEAAVALKYLGAAYAVVGLSDSAVTTFVQALAHDPFVDLDPSKFSAAELGPFKIATIRVLRVGVRPPVVEGDTLYRFAVVTTHRATLNVELVNATDSTKRETLFNGVSDGLREIRWDGILRSRPEYRAQSPEPWIVRLTAVSQTAGGTRATASEPFMLAPRAIAAAAVAPVGRVMLGSIDSVAFLYINGRIESRISSEPQWWTLPARQNVALSIRTPSCPTTPWDTTIQVEAGASVTIGRRGICGASAAEFEMIATAIGQTRRQLNGTWRRGRDGIVRVARLGVDFAGPGGSAVEAALSDVDVSAQVTALGECNRQTCWRGAPFLRDTVLVDGAMAFNWRTQFGQNRRATARVVLTYLRRQSGMDLQSIVVTP